MTGQMRNVAAPVSPAKMLSDMQHNDLNGPMMLALCHPKGMRYVVSTIGLGKPPPPQEVSIRGWDDDLGHSRKRKHEEPAQDVIDAAIFCPVKGTRGRVTDVSKARE